VGDPAGSCLRSTTSNNRSCTSQLRSGTFLLGSTTLHRVFEYFGGFFQCYRHYIALHVFSSQSPPTLPPPLSLPASFLISPHFLLRALPLYRFLDYPSSSFLLYSLLFRHVALYCLVLSCPTLFCEKFRSDEPT